MPEKSIVQVGESQECCNAAWEEAYLRFETPEEEINKFMARLRKAGASGWQPHAQIVELFCGRGNGLKALERLGFKFLDGVDLSATLLAKYQGPAKCYVCDCRQLPFGDECKDVVVVQGGLHHLTVLPQDLEQTLAEINRVLRRDGRLVAVEPWLTPFLSFVHWVSQTRAARRLSRKIDALATMIQHERQTYEQWLSKPQAILDLFRKYFEAETCSFAWGKLTFVGKKRGPPV